MAYLEKPFILGTRFSDEPVFYKQITFQHGLPFPVKLPDKELNVVSINAMEEKDLDEYKNSSEL
jgi:hypothetical protein